MPTNKEVANLKINTLKKKKYEDLFKRSELNEDELYFVVDNNEKTEYGDLYGNIENQKDLDNALYASRLHLKDMSNDVRGYEAVHRLYDRREFELSKFTVVGNPTITEDGIASGFSGNNFLSLSPIHINNIQRLDIECSFLVGDNISTQQFPFGSTAYAQLSVQIRGGILMANTGTDNNWHGDIHIIENLQPNTLVYLKCHFTTNGRSFEYSTDGVNYTSITGDTFTFIGDTYAFTPRIGLGRSGTAHFLGSIDLKQFSITVDGKEVFNGIKDFTQYDTYTLPSEQVITIPYILSKDGARIVDVVYKPLVDQLYAETGKGNYIIIDETNKTFRLPTPDIYSLLEQKAAVITFRKWEEE